MSTKLATALVEVKTSGMGNLNRELDQTKGLLTRAFGGIATAATGMLAGFGLSSILGEMAQFGAASLKMAADAETIETAFKVLVGSAEGAQKLLADLRKFAAETPFEFPELADAGKKLLAFGVGADDVVETLRRIGDIASGIGAPVGELAELYGKARVQGRLFAEDINQLTGRGIPIIQELAKQFGVTEAEVRGLVESGAVGFDNLERAFQDLTNEGGKFFGMTAEQSKTTKGLWSTMKDSIADVQRALGALLIEGFDVKELLKNLAAAAADMNKALTEVGPELRDSMAAVGDALAMIGETLTGTTDRAEAFRFTLVKVAQALEVVAEQLKVVDLLLDIQSLKDIDFSKILKGDIKGLTEDTKQKIESIRERFNSLNPRNALPIWLQDSKTRAAAEAEAPSAKDAVAAARDQLMKNLAPTPAIGQEIARGFKQDWDAVRDNRAAEVKDPFAAFMEEELARAQEAQENRTAEVKPPMAPDDVEALAEALGMTPEAIRDLFKEGKGVIGGTGFSNFADLSKKMQEGFLNQSSPQEKLVKIAEEQKRLQQEEKNIQQEARDALEDIRKGMSGIGIA